MTGSAPSSHHRNKTRTGSQKIRLRVYQLLETGSLDDPPSLIVDVAIFVLILINALAFVLNSIPSYQLVYHDLFNWIERLTIAIFTTEYALRIWASVEHPPLQHLPLGKARLQYSLGGFAILDFAAIIPFYLQVFIGIDSRIAQILRLIRFLKIARYSAAVSVILRVFMKERHALAGVTMILFIVLMISAGGMYHLEREAQPVAFGTVPDAMWWSLAALTTVGFGDVVPHTPWGKVFGSLFMFFGIGIWALPVGIISAAFAREISRRRFVITWAMLARIPIFERLHPTELVEAMELLQSRRVPAGAQIVRTDDLPSEFYILGSGIVSIEFAERIETLSPGDFFGEMALLLGNPFGFSARAKTECDLFILDAADFHHFLSRFETFNADIRHIATERTFDWHILEPEPGQR